MAGNKNNFLTTNDVKHVAQLAKLTLTEEEIKKFQSQLAQILEYINQLQDVDTSGVEETSQVTGLTNVFREDEVGECLSQDKALSNAKQQQAGYFKVPGILHDN